MSTAAIVYLVLLVPMWGIFGVWFEHRIKSATPNDLRTASLFIGLMAALVWPAWLPVVIVNAFIEKYA